MHMVVLLESLRNRCLVIRHAPQALLILTSTHALDLLDLPLPTTPTLSPCCVSCCVEEESTRKIQIQIWE